jgi:D-alanyl-D-alanine carboxypeptidase
MLLSPASEWAGGGFVTGVLSLAQFVRAYASGRAFDKPYLHDLRRIVRFSWQPGRISGYGIGLFAMMTPLGPAWGHGGYYPGYRTDMLYFSDHDLAVAYQVNSSMKITNYPKIVETRETAAKMTIADDAPLSVVTEASVELAAAALGITLPAPESSS